MQAEVFFAFVFIFVGAIVMVTLNNRFRVRELEHKEALAALEKGVDLPVRQTQPWTPRIYLLHGMIWLFAGLGAMAALIGISATSVRVPSMEEKLRAVSEARSRGATPEEAQMLLHDPHTEQGIPVGVGLLGLIPVGIGMAYLIFYGVERKKLIS
jgi:hypothetical protein